MTRLTDKGFEAYVIGGAVRDFLLGKEPHDYDIFTNANGEQLFQVFPEANIIGNDERQEKILTIIVDGVEISQYRSSGDRTETGGTLIAHMATCDFTINAMAVNLKGEILDVFNGQADLANKHLRFVGSDEQRVKEDPLRIFRGVRFMAKYNLQPTSKIFWTFEQYVSKLPVERVRDEFLKIIMLDNGLAILNKYYMLHWIIPEYRKCVGLYGGIHHNENVDEHLLYSAKYALRITDNKLIVLTALLHDIGKGTTMEVIDGKQTYYEHDTIGEQVVREWMNSMKFSNDDIRFVTTIISSHMFAFDVEKRTNKSIIKQFTMFDDRNIAIEDFVAVCYCDAQGNMAKEREKFLDYLNNSFIKAKYYELKQKKTPFKITDLEIGGKDVMKLGLRGKAIGDVLKTLHNAVLDGEIPNSKPELMLAMKCIVDVKVNELIMEGKNDNSRD